MIRRRTSLFQPAAMALGLFALAGCIPSGTPAQAPSANSEDAASTIISDCNKITPLVNQAAVSIRLLDSVFESRSMARYANVSAELSAVGKKMQALQINDPTLREANSQIASAYLAFEDANAYDLGDAGTVDEFQEIVGLALDQYALGLSKLRACDTGP